MPPIGACGSPHLTPTLSAPKGGEGDIWALGYVHALALARGEGISPYAPSPRLRGEGRGEGLLRAVMDALYRFCVIVAGGALVLISAVIAWGVFTRYVLNSAASWPEPLAILLTIVLTFFGAAACYRASMHMSVSVLVSRVTIEQVVRDLAVLRGDVLRADAGYLYSVRLIMVAADARIVRCTQFVVNLVDLELLFR